MVSGLRDLVLLKSTGSEFHGFLTDSYTTLQPTTDRVMATSLTARWRWRADAGVDGRRRATRSGRSWCRGSAGCTAWPCSRRCGRWASAVLAAEPTVGEVRLSAPNKHHFLADLAPFGLENPGEVFWAADRPYGLIEVEVRRDDEDRAGGRVGRPARLRLTPDGQA